MVRLQVQESGAVAVLTLPATLTPRHTDSLKTLLRRSLEQEGRLILDCNKVSSVDSDCLIILCAALRLSRQMHKDVVLAGNRPAPFLAAAKTANFMHCIGCDEGCIWGESPETPVSGAAWRAE
jgi:anti-anti-sigma regulatory factor